MMSNKYLLILIPSLFFFISIVTSCATYQIQEVDVKPAEIYKNKASKNGINIALDPYDNKEKCESAFYLDLTSKDIKVLHVIVENDSDSNIGLERIDVRVFDKNGKQYKQLTSNQVFEMFDYNEILHGLAFGIFGALSADDANEAMITDWNTKELQEVSIIKSGVDESGFVFFQTKNKLVGSIAEIDVRNIDTDEEISFEIPVL